MMIAYGFIKLSIVAFYRRLFVVHRRTSFDIAAKITMLVIFLWSIAFILMTIFACGIQFWANWGSTASMLEFCPFTFTTEYGLIISDLILDVFIFLMPIHQVSISDHMQTYNADG